jgi:hypothetical protein
MQGPTGNPGIIPRAMGLLFDITARDAIRYQVTFACYMLELYNDRLVDLFGDPSDTKALAIKKDSTVCFVVIILTILRGLYLYKMWLPRKPSHWQIWKLLWIEASRHGI